MEELACKIKGCDKHAIKNGLGYCKQHFLEHKETEYLDNTDPNNLGILKWARDHLPNYLPNKTPKFHIKILLLLLRLYHPFLRNKMERLLNVVSWRGSAKSTLITMIFPAYLLVHNGKSFKIKIDDEIIECKINERFICIISETGDMAEDFVVRIRDEFLTNRTLKYFYQYKIEDAIDDRTGQLTRKAFKFNGCYILGVGSGMQVRGRIKGAYRVTLMIADDLYSERKIKNPIGRANIRTWWNAAVKNSVDDLMGKIAALGTILHEDTVIVDMIKNSLWKTELIRLMPLELFNEFITKYMNINESSGECELPYEDVTDEYERIRLRRNFYEEINKSKDWQISWTDRIDLYMIALLIADAVKNRALATLYQEYLHEILPDSNKRFHKEYFQPLPTYSIIKSNDTNWFNCPDMYPQPIPIRIVIGVDTGTGTLDGDDSAIVALGILADGRWIVLRTIYGKYGMRDETFINTATDNRYDKVITSRKFVRRIGFIDEAFRLAEELNADKVKVGYAGSEKTILKEFVKIFNASNSRCTVTGRKQLSYEGIKIERIQNTLLSKYMTYSVWHVKGLQKLEHQLEYLGSSKEDDIADAEEVAAYAEVPPHWEEYVEEVNVEYNPKMETSRFEARQFFEQLARRKN